MAPPRCLVPSPTGAPQTAGTADASVSELKARLQSLQDHCLSNLSAGLEAIAAGDPPLAVQPATTPLDVAIAQSQELRELLEVFNATLGKTRDLIGSYNAMREQHRALLSDRSRLVELQQRLASIIDHRLAGLAKPRRPRTRGPARPGGWPRSRR